MSTIAEHEEGGATVLVLGSGSCRIEGGAGLFVLRCFKADVELPHLREEGLGEEEARRRAASWLVQESMKAASFEGRREARIDGLRAAGARRKGASAAAMNRAHEIGQRFEGGQPIILDHHSTKRALRDRDRMDGAMRRSISLEDEAADLLRRASAAEKNAAISSDDPDAIAKVAVKLKAELEEHELCKRVRKAVLAARRKPGPDGPDNAEVRVLMSAELGLTQAQQRHFASNPVEDWTLKNSSGRIRQTKERLATLLKLAERMPPEPEEIGDVRVFEEENRVRIQFPRRVSDAMADKLSRCGFHWSHIAGAWQRMGAPHPEAVWTVARDLAREYPST